MKTLLQFASTIAIAAIMFMIGKGCGEQIIVPPPPVIDSADIWQVRAMMTKYHKRADSLAEENRELEVMIVRQQDELAAIKSNINVVERRASKYARMYDAAKQQLDTLTMISKCDSLRAEYEVYKQATQEFVDTADMIMGNLFKANNNLTDINADQRLIISNLNDRFEEAVYDKDVATIARREERKRTKFWRKATVIAAAVAGVLLIAR